MPNQRHESQLVDTQKVALINSKTRSKNKKAKDDRDGGEASKNLILQKKKIQIVLQCSDIVGWVTGN